MVRLVDEGGDWDRRNRLKAYQGLYMISIRNFKLGAELLLDTISTFTATELISYDQFVLLAVLAGVLVLDRKQLKQKVCPRHFFPFSFLVGNSLNQIDTLLGDRFT